LWHRNSFCKLSSHRQSITINISYLSSVNDTIFNHNNLKYKPLNKLIMKTKLRFLRWLMMLILSASATGAWAQYNQNPTQTVCISTQNYYVVPGNLSNSFLWSISPGSTGLDWTINSPNAANTDIVWLIAGTYTVTLTETNGLTCENIVTIQVTVDPAPVAPTSGGNIAQCEQSPIQTLTATASAPSGSTVVWYTGATGGTVVASPTLSTVGTITYYAESVVTVGGCTSLSRTAVTLTINPAPVAPTSGGNIAQCEQSPIQTLTATASAPSGSTVVWYTGATGGTVVASPTLNTVGTVTYYAESVVTVGGCTSLSRTAVTLTINPMPATSPIWHK
jgi:hypothetical protein